MAGSLDIGATVMGSTSNDGAIASYQETNARLCKRPGRTLWPDALGKGWSSVVSRHDGPMGAAQLASIKARRAASTQRVGGAQTSNWRGCWRRRNPAGSNRRGALTWVGPDGLGRRPTTSRIRPAPGRINISITKNCPARSHGLGLVHAPIELRSEMSIVDSERCLLFQWRTDNDRLFDVKAGDGPAV